MNVILNVTTTPIALPAGVTAGLLALSITDPSGQSLNDANGQSIAVQQVNGTTATFANVAAGNYLASAVRLDTNGAPIGTPITQAFTVAASTSATAGTSDAAPDSTAAAGTTTGGAQTPNPTTAAAAATFDAPQSITVTLA